MVGVNKYVASEEKPIEILKIGRRRSRSASSAQLAAIKAGARRRRASPRSLEAVRARRARKDNLMPLILEAVRDARAPSARSAGAIKTVFGEYREVSVF